MYGLFEPFPLGDILSGGKTDQKNPRHEPWSVCENLLMSENILAQYQSQMMMLNNQLRTYLILFLYFTPGLIKVSNP